MLLPLHVFEPRYRKLVRDCRERERQFGIALISSGEEVGPPAHPHPVGTAARILGLRELPDGRFFLIARGERRFAIESLATDEEPYLVAGVRWLEERDGDGSAELAERARTAFAEYRLAVTSVGTQRYAEAAAEPETTTPIELSYAIAAGLAVDADERQRLLEAASASERLRAALAILERESALLRELLVRQHARGEGPRPN